MDQTQDLSGQKLYRFAQLYGAPEFVKTAGVEELCGSELPTEVYADPIHRHYPCHTPAATWASAVFFLEKKAAYKPLDAKMIQERLDYYTGYHGIEATINGLRSKVAAIPVAEILSDDDYALVTNEQRYYPLRNSAEVKTAAAYLNTHRDRFPYDIRREWAEKVMLKAAQHGCHLDDLTDYIERQAGYGACTVKTAVEAMRDRVRASRKGPGADSQLQSEMLKLAETLEHNPSKLRAPGMMTKLAAVIDTFDRTTGLNREYGSHFKRVEDVLFELTQEKMASVVRDHFSTTTGNIYKLADVEKLRMDDARTYLGDEFVDAVSTGKRLDSEKLAAVVPTLDRGTAELFDALMSAVGMGPVAKEASAPIGISRSYMLQLASSYKEAAKKQ